MCGGDHHYKILKSGVMDTMRNITDRSIPSIAKSLFNTSEIAHNMETRILIKRQDKNEIKDKTRFAFSSSFACQPENEVLAFNSKHKRFRYVETRRPMTDIIVFDIYSITKELDEADESGCYAYYDGYSQAIIWED